MSPVIACPASSHPIRYQFQTRSLLLATFAVALCGALFQISVALGFAAIGPVMLGLVRALNPRVRRRHGLLVTFVQSIGLAVSLLMIVCLDFVALAAVGMLFLLTVINGILAWASAIVRDHLCKRRRFIATLARLVAYLTRQLTVATTFLRNQAIAAVNSLNHMRRKLVAVLST